MFERFGPGPTGRRPRADEARSLNHNLGAEHLLLGLITEGEGVKAAKAAGRVLTSIRMRFAQRDIIGEGEKPVEGPVLSPLAPSAF